MNTTLQVRMPKKLKQDAEAVFKEIGIDASTVIRMFFAYIVRNKKLPPELTQLEKD